MRVLLVSTYELGHQPLHVASPAAALSDAGHEVRCLDTAVEPWDPESVEWAGAVAFSVPMHTAMRLALSAARRVRLQRPDLPICLYGLYAPVSRDLTLGAVADSLIAGEYEPALVAWADALARARPGDPAAKHLLAAGSAETTPSATDEHPAELVTLTRSPFRVPRRDLLPPLERYARLSIAGEERLAGYVEGSHGCAHNCRHCPVPTVYGGRIRLVPQEVVLADVDQQVARGARHITFGDPDFLNGWRHSLSLVRELHSRHPDVTFDCTTKVDHVLEREDLWPELAGAGCLFVVCALESVNDEILERLDKGHTTAQAVEAIAVLRTHGIEVRPSFLPFTPWTTPRDVVDLLDFVLDHGLIPNVDPVQYGIRLLLPEGSLLLERPDVREHLGPYDPEMLTYTWRSADPASDELAARVAAIVHEGAHGNTPAAHTYLAVRAAALEAAGHRRRELEATAIEAGSQEGRPRLTEPWFC